MTHDPHLPHFRPKLFSIAAVVTAVVLGGLVLVNRYAEQDLSRDMQGWREKLNLIAESRADDLNQYVAAKFSELRAMAENQSMQLYLLELESAATEKTKSGNEPPQRSYLRNLLVFTAERGGFSAPQNSQIPANIEQEGKGGLAVFSANGDMLVATSMSPARLALLRERTQRLSKGEEHLIDMEKDAEGAVYLGYAVPIYAIQAEKVPESQIGWVVGIQAADDALFSHLKHPGIIEKTLESILVREKGGKLEYLSPLLDGSSALVKTSGMSDKRLAEPDLVRDIGSFSGDRKDYRDRAVLATSRAIAGTPWVMIVKIERAEAMEGSDKRRANMVVFFFMLIGMVALLMFAIWWYAHSKRSMVLSQHFKDLAAKSQADAELVRLVADHQVEPIYIVDHEMKLHFANEKTALMSGMSVQSLLGKGLSDVFGSARSRPVRLGTEEALLQQAVLSVTDEHSESPDAQVRRIFFVPLAHIPIATLPNPTPGVLVVEQDISDVVHERMARETMMRELVQTLVRLVDKRDPFSANHSLLVSEVSETIAHEMELDDALVDTARTAASLMNIGKIIVPRKLLTKTEKLTEDEKKVIQDSFAMVPELLKNVPFEGDVAGALAQWQEKWDGSGALGLKGEAIYVPARIVAVANAFIGMVSPRSWRTALSIEEASKQLLAASETHYDRRVVIALLNFLGTERGKEWAKNRFRGAS